MKNFIKHLISSLKVFLKIKNPTGYYYEEKDTKCDNCCLRKICAPFLCDVTYSADERQHVLNPPSYSCPKDYCESDVKITMEAMAREYHNSFDVASLYPVFTAKNCINSKKES